MTAADGVVRVEAPGYASPCWADVDGDGKKDLLVGQFKDGKIRVFKGLGGEKLARCKRTAPLALHRRAVLVLLDVQQLARHRQVGPPAALLLARLDALRTLDDAREKFAHDVPSDLRLHLIGSLQTNKARAAAGLFRVFHALDRVEIALVHSAGRSREVAQREYAPDGSSTVGFFLAQEVYWYNPAKIPSPTEWVNVRRMRVKDSVEPCWWQ